MARSKSTQTHPPAKAPGKGFDQPTGAELVCVGALHVALTALMTYPALFIAHRALIGIPRGDKFQFIWIFWWLREALIELHQLPFFTELQYYPTGVSLALHDMSYFWSLLSVPLQSFLDPRFILNLFLLVCFPLNGVCFYKLAREVTGSSPGALAGSVVFAFSPYLLGRFYVSHIQYLGAFFIPLFVLCLWRYARNRLPVHLRMAGLWLGLQSLITFYYGMALLALLVAFVVVQLMRDRTKVRDTAYWQDWAKALAQLGLFSTLLVAPVALPMASALWSESSRAEASDGGDWTGEENLAYNSADLAAHFVPDHTMASWRGWRISPAMSSLRSRVSKTLHGSPFERSVYPGWLAWIALLAVVGTRALRRRYWPFVVLLIGATLFSLGPTLHVAGHPLLEGAMPAALASSLPGLGMLRSATRFSVFGLLGAGVLVAAVVAQLGSAQSLRIRWALSAAAILFTVLEFVPRPVSHFSFQAWLSPFYETIAEDARAVSVLNVPLDFRDPRGGADLYEYAQVIHHKPIIGGYVSREPAAVFAPLAQSAFLRSVLSREYADDPRLELGEEGLADMHASLEELGVGYVVVHRQLLEGEEWPRVNRWLMRGLGDAVFEDRWIRAYRYPPP